MICHKYKTIFIHIPKTGGTSIEEMFGFVKYIEKYNAFEEISQPGKHWTARINKHARKECWENYFKWTIVRNPWQKEWSYYNMMQSIRREKINFKKHLKENVVPYVNMKSINSVRDQHSELIHACQVDYFMIDGELAVDEIVRFENLENGIKNINKTLKTPFKTLRKIRNPQKKDITEDYDQECIDIVAKLRKKDIDYLKYDLPKKLQ
jgi:hypothetical protein